MPLKFVTVVFAISLGNVFGNIVSPLRTGVRFALVFVAAWMIV